MRPAHRRGSYETRATACVAGANANPTTICGSPHCIGWGNRTLAEHPAHKSGRPPTWQAGHVNDGQIDGPLRPEVSVCNQRAGRILGNTRRGMKTLTPTRAR